MANELNADHEVFVNEEREHHGLSHWDKLGILNTYNIKFIHALYVLAKLIIHTAQFFLQGLYNRV